MNEDQTQPKETTSQTTPEMSLNFKVTYEWIGTDFVVHLTDQYGYFDLRITFHFEYDNDGNLVRRECVGQMEFSEPMRVIAGLNKTTIQRPRFWNWIELASIIEALPGWIRNMIDMRVIRKTLDAVPATA